MTKKLTSKPIAIAADHRGFPLKEHIKGWLQGQGYAVTDCGADSPDLRVDALDYALKLVREIKQGRSDFAIGICGSGQMMAMTANRFPFIRAALLHTPDEAGPARQHGDANILALGADTISISDTDRMLEIFLATSALGDRYAARRDKLAGLNIEEI